MNWYEPGMHAIPCSVAVAIDSIATTRLPLLGIVAAGRPIEPIPQIEQVDVPRGMKGKGETFALKIRGSSMRNEGILPGDIVIVHKQSTARSGQTVVALVDGEATIKKYVRKADRIELHPANDTLTPMVLTPEQDFRIEGVVTGVIRYCD
jgi:repressor LexA